MRTADVVVVGAGPAGSAAAIELARSGREVVVVDKATFPRDKCCGDGLTTGALRHLDALGLDPRAVASWHPVPSCWIRSPSGRSVEFAFPTDGAFGVVARRTDLDHALVERSRAAGAEVWEGRGFADLRCSPDGVTLSLEGGDCIAARYVVAADGMWSKVRKALGLSEPGYLGEWHAFRQYIRAPGPKARDMWVWFDESLLPGYAWSFPLPDGAANVGFGILRKPGEPTRSMAATWRRVLQLDYIAEALGRDFDSEQPHKAWPIPARLPATAVDGANGRVMFVGDAARAADPMTGEGIGQALETGRLAAAAIITAGPGDSPTAARLYRAALHRGMTWDHRMSALLALALRSPKGARGAVRIAGATPWTRRNFSRWLFEDYPRALLATPGRWHRGMFHGRGAYAGAA